MIKSIWLRIVLLLAFAVLPATLLQLKLQEDSVALVFKLAERTSVRSSLDQHLTHLKEAAKDVPEKESHYKNQFQETLQVKRSVEEFFLARGPLDRDIRRQTLLITVLTLIASLGLSIIISRGIVRRVRSLIQEQEKSASKLRELAALTNWQTVARVLVHELRAPMTPIKLVATDIETKFASLNSNDFAKYLQNARAMVLEQVDSIETMISGFTTFGRLPPPEFRRTDLNLFLVDFVENYDNTFGPDVSINVILDSRKILTDMDPKLIRDLLFNLLKNAAEANNSATKITVKQVVEKEHVYIFIHNTGKQIPQDLRESIFNPYVSTKKDQALANMGLGLTIARKIALDHGGDLTVSNNDTHDGVTFCLELPLAKSSFNQNKTT